MSELQPKARDGTLTERFSTKVPIIESDKDSHAAGNLRIKSGKDRLFGKFAEPEATTHYHQSE